QQVSQSGAKESGRYAASADERRVAFFDRELTKHIRNTQLPDPTVVTTLGEALITLALTTQDNRNSAVKEFRTRLLNRFPDLRVHAKQLADHQHRRLPGLIVPSEAWASPYQQQGRLVKNVRT